MDLLAGYNLCGIFSEDDSSCVYSTTGKIIGWQRSFFGTDTEVVAALGGSIFLYDTGL